MAFTEAPDGSYGAGHEFGDANADSVWNSLDLTAKVSVMAVCLAFQGKNKESL